MLVRDNAPIHKARLVKARVAAWATAGVTLLFLLPYPPQLNRIDILRRFCKHHRLTPDARQTPLTLLQQRTDLLPTSDTPEYRITSA